MTQQISPAQALAQAKQANMQARQAILATALDMFQQTAQITLVGNPVGQVVPIPLRNVGLLKRIIVKVTGTFAQSAAETQRLTKLGLMNVLSNILLTDLSNQQRINTTGWHLCSIASAKRQGIYGAAYLTDTPFGFGSNVKVINAPAAIQAAQSFTMFYEVPISYSDTDLRGAIFANLVNSTFNLQVTVNPNFSVGNAADATLAVYQSSTAGDLGTLSNVTITIFQNYLDQLPQTKNGPLLPNLDISTAYDIKNTAVSALTVSQDNPINYANFRDFMSTCVIYDNIGLNPATDINYFALQSANYTNIFKMDAITQCLRTRNIVGDDFPPGFYYFSHRDRPIRTSQFGNMQLIVNPSNVAGAASQLLVGFEALEIINQVNQAGSLYAV